MKIDRTDQAVETIEAVHLAHLDLNHLRAWRSVIRDYFEANQEAIARGVKITRIFVLDPDTAWTDEKLHPEIIDILDEQALAGIQVRVLFTDELRNKNLRMPLDLIIFDRKEVHLHIQGIGGIYTEVDVLVNKKQVRDWYEDFILWEECSLPWSRDLLNDPV